MIKLYLFFLAVYNCDAEKKNQETVNKYIFGFLPCGVTSNLTWIGDSDIQTSANRATCICLNISVKRQSSTMLISSFSSMPPPPTQFLISSSTFWLFYYHLFDIPKMHHCAVQHSSPSGKTKLAGFSREKRESWVPLHYSTAIHSSGQQLCRLPACQNTSSPCKLLRFFFWHPSCSKAFSLRKGKFLRGKCCYILIQGLQPCSVLEWQSPQSQLLLKASMRVWVGLWLNIKYIKWVWKFVCYPKLMYICGCGMKWI